MERSILAEDNHFRKQRGDQIYVQVGKGQPIQMISCRLQSRRINTIVENSPDRFDLGIKQGVGHISGKNMLQHTNAKKSRFTLTIKPIRKKESIQLNCQILEMTPNIWTFVVVQ